MFGTLKRKISRIQTNINLKSNHKRNAKIDSNFCENLAQNAEKIEFSHKIDRRGHKQWV